MRVLHVLHSSLPFVCGYSIRSGHIVRQQKARGYEVLVVTSAQHPNGPEAVEVIDGIEHRRTPTYRGRAVPLWREWHLMRSLGRMVARAAADWAPDLIHAHSPVLVSLPALRAARALGKPFVYEVRDLWENASVDRGRFGTHSPQYQLARALDTYVLRSSDAVTTICETLRAELLPRSGGVDKVQVVANGVDVETFFPRPGDAAVRGKYRVDSKHVILYAGTFQPYEGLRLLVEAMPSVLSRVPTAHLLIVGGSATLQYGGLRKGTPQEDALNLLVAQLGLGDAVTLTGQVAHRDMAELYAIADAVAYPRVLTRTTALTTPLKPLEAMACGRPVIVSDIAPMRELVQEGVTGLSFPAGQATALAERCVELLLDSGLRTRLGSAARAFVVDKRRWSDLVAAYEAVYRKVTAQGV